jgi:hypothetical protein
LYSTYFIVCVFANSSQSRGEALDLQHWSQFVDHFYSPAGVLRHGVLPPQQNVPKMLEITCAMLPRYYHTLFNSGIRRIQTHMEQTRERELPTGGYVVESLRTCYLYWFSNECQVRPPNDVKRVSLLIC